ncbi:MAG: ADP-heptose--LPS heptosyltransferase 2 [Elusimicrobia bacterium ADurb.Bin231]|nr:MAG: ADP-heptose--LPS heptosyltransferase 2 [Elusimicrobia bacterium ADurb.Bin231]
MFGGDLKTLVIQTAYLGDLVLTLPLIGAVKRILGSELHVLSIPSNRDIITGHPSVDKIIVYDKKKSEKGWLSFIRLVLCLRKEKYDIVFVPHPSFRSALLAFLTGASQRVGFSNSAGRIFFSSVVKFDADKHQCERYLDLLKNFSAGYTGTTDFQFFIKTDEESEKRAAEIIGKNKLYVGLNPGSVWATKRWLPEYYAELGDAVYRELRCDVIIFGGPEDINIAEDVSNMIKCPHINLAGKTGLKLLSALIKRCAVFVTNDSGPMHIAASFGVPTVAIFGPTIKEFGFSPYSKNSVVVEKCLYCRPCGNHGPAICPEGHFKCMRDILVQDVFAEVKKMIVPLENQ